MDIRQSVNAAKRIILLLWLLILGLGNVSALMSGTLETRVWEKSASTFQSCSAQPLKTADLHQENGPSATMVILAYSNDPRRTALAYDAAPVPIFLDSAHSRAPPSEKGDFIAAEIVAAEVTRL